MFNPLSLLSRPLLSAMAMSGKRYFIRQTFNRARDQFNGDIKGCFLITHYSEASHALHHLSAISHDPHRCIYDWKDPEDRRKLLVAATQPAGYKIYSAVLEDGWKKHITQPFRQKARRYFESTLGYKPGSRDTVGFDMYLNHGEMYAALQLRTYNVRVKLEEIEACA